MRLKDDKHKRDIQAAARSGHDCSSQGHRWGKWSPTPKGKIQRICCKCGNREFCAPARFPTWWIRLDPATKHARQKEWSTKRAYWIGHEKAEQMFQDSALGWRPGPSRCGVIDVDTGSRWTVLAHLTLHKVKPLACIPSQTPGHWHIIVPTAEDPTPDFKYQFDNGTSGEWKSNGYVKVNDIDSTRAAIARRTSRTRLFDPSTLPTPRAPEPDTPGPKPPGTKPPAFVRIDRAPDPAEGSRHITHFCWMRAFWNQHVWSTPPEQIESLRTNAVNALWQSLSNRKDYPRHALEALSRNTLAWTLNRKAKGHAPIARFSRFTTEQSSKGGSAARLNEARKKLPSWLKWVQMHKEGLSNAAIARKVGRHRSTIGRAIHHLSAHVIPSKTQSASPILRFRKRLDILNTTPTQLHGWRNTPWSPTCKAAIDAWFRLTNAPIPWFTQAPEPT